MTRHEPLLATVLPSIGFDDLGRLLRANGYAIEPIEEMPRRGYRTIVEPRFVIELYTPFHPRPGEFGAISLWTRMHLPPTVVAAAERQLRWQTTFGHVLVDSQGCLVATQAVVVFGGVTEYYLRDQIWYWCQTLKQVQETVRKCMAGFEGRTLH